MACLVCSRCERAIAPPEAWRCPDCGALTRWRLGAMAPDVIDTGVAGAWRYGAALPPVPVASRCWLGAGMTPLYQPDPSWPALKVDSLLPTGSYKERGASVLVASLAAEDAGRALYDDSSGNAGAALAAYGRVVGSAVTVLAPAATSPGKLALIRAFGARVELVEGDRASVSAAAASRAGAAGGSAAGSRPRDFSRAGGEVWASHVWDPRYPAGCATALWEVWEQRDFFLPATIYLACGHGSQVLGAIGALEALGALDGQCRIVGVQSRAYPALAAAAGRGQASTVAVKRGTTIAEGIACVDPPRGAELLAGVARSGGAWLTVDDAEITDAARALAGTGQLVEPTGAVALAGWRQARASGDPTADPGDSVVVLSGSGLKALDQLLALFAT